MNRQVTTSKACPLCGNRLEAVKNRLDVFACKNPHCGNFTPYDVCDLKTLPDYMDSEWEQARKRWKAMLAAEALNAKPAPAPLFPAPRFKVGDLVMLKSGGPVMTVEGVSGMGHYARCEWFYAGESRNRTFSFDVLKSMNDSVPGVLVQRSV